MRSRLGTRYMIDFIIVGQLVRCQISKECKILCTIFNHATSKKRKNVKVEFLRKPIFKNCIQAANNCQQQIKVNNHFKKNDNGIYPFLVLNVTFSETKIPIPFVWFTQLYYVQDVVMFIFFSERYKNFTLVMQLHRARSFVPTKKN